MLYGYDDVDIELVLELSLREELSRSLENGSTTKSSESISLPKKESQLESFIMQITFHNQHVISTFLVSKGKSLFAKDIYEALFFKSLWAKINKRGMHFVKQDVHQPSEEEGQPPDHDHHPDLKLCQWMRISIHINEFHTLRQTGLY